MHKHKKILIEIIIFAGISIFLLQASFAGTVGNTALVTDPKGEGVFSLKKSKNFVIKFGVDTEFLFDRDLKTSDAVDSEITSAQWYMGKVSCVLFERFEPYLKLGVGHMKVKWTEAGKKAKLDSQNGFVWSLGGKVLVWDFKQPNIKLVADGYYRVDDLTVEKAYYGGNTITIDRDSSRFYMREWQLSLIAATEIDVTPASGTSDLLGLSKLVPYGGVMYSDLNGRLRAVWSGNASYNNPGHISSKNKFGIVVGCDFVGPNSIAFNLESRFIDETAITAGLDMLL